MSTSPIASFCFIVGAGAGLCGMSLGIFMGISQDVALTPVHAHVNLLGWVSMMLYGLYYRGAGPAARLAIVQVGAATIGLVAMSVGLWALLSGAVPPIAGEVATIAGSLFTIGSMGLFLAILIGEARAGRPRYSEL